MKECGKEWSDISSTLSKRNNGQFVHPVPLGKGLSNFFFSSLTDTRCSRAWSLTFTHFSSQRVARLLGIS